MVAIVGCCCELGWVEGVEGVGCGWKKNGRRERSRRPRVAATETGARTRESEREDAHEELTELDVCFFIILG